MHVAPELPELLEPLPFEFFELPDPQLLELAGLEAGGQWPEARGQSSEARAWRPEPEGQSPEARARRPEASARGKCPEARGQKPEAGGERAEPGGQSPESNFLNSHLSNTNARCWAGTNSVLVRHDHQ